MTENRLFAGWLRSITAIAAVAGTLGLSACGGGSGAPNNPFESPGPLTVLPDTMTVYSGTPATVTIAGGNPPYTLVSSDQTALPVQSNGGGNFTAFPNTVGESTSVTLTARDAQGSTKQSAVTINPSALINSLKLKADAYVDGCPNPTGSSNPTDEVVSTFVCSGQTASIAVTSASPVGGVVGRMIRFDIVQGAFQIFTELPGQTPTFALTYTVPNDQNGTAVARIRAIPGASTQTVIVQATDVITGAFVRGTFVIVSVNNANAADLIVIPKTVTVTGPDNQTCQGGVPSTFYIYGGAPPYTVSNTFPQAVSVSPTTVQVSGAGFTVTTTSQCVDPVTLIITDSARHSTTVTLTNKPGTGAPPTTTKPNPIIVTPSAIPPLACGAPTSITISGGGTTTTTGNSQDVTPASFSVSVNDPSVISLSTQSFIGGAGTVIATLGRVSGAPAMATYTLNILDGQSGLSKFVPIPIAAPTTTCP